MPREGFEPSIPVFGRAKTFHALDGTATLIGLRDITETKTLHRDWASPCPKFANTRRNLEDECSIFCIVSTRRMHVA
jgi:hypothetical protein